MSALPDGSEFRRAPVELRCPTCRAVLQDWTETCRRCKCDLSLLQAFTTAYDQSHSACQAAILAGAGPEAIRHAQRCRQLRPDAKSDRLLALAALVLGDYPTALQLGTGVKTTQE